MDEVTLHLPQESESVSDTVAFLEDEIELNFD